MLWATRTTQHDTTMLLRFYTSLWLICSISAFSGCQQQIVSPYTSTTLKRSISVARTTNRCPTSMVWGAATTDDCGCGNAPGISKQSTIFSGKPSASARRSDPRQAIKIASPIYNVEGKPVLLEDLLTRNSSVDDAVSIVVFLRSLGWPLCQEFLVQWSRRTEELNSLGVNLVMVSIGKPEIGKQLIQHLEIPNGKDYLFVDPESVLYDDLLLNKGIKETFFSVSTPFAFLNRVTKKDGMKDLNQVLSKWREGKWLSIGILSLFLTRDSNSVWFCKNLCIISLLASFMPPRQDQAFNQGGTFLFDGFDTVFAHYDESTGAHSDIDQVIRLAKDRVRAKVSSPTDIATS